MGREFADALAERARAGVKVNVLLDWAGSLKMDEAMLDEMKAAGVSARRITWQEWQQRPWSERFWETLARTLRTLLRAGSPRVAR